MGSTTVKEIGANNARVRAAQRFASATKRMYGGRAAAGSIDLAVASTFDRLEARHRDDAETLAQTRATRRRITHLLEERHVSPEDAHAMLSTYLEHEALKPSPEALSKRWPAEWEAIRLAAGSTEAAEKVLTDANAFYRAITQADPAFAHSVKTNGSAETARMIQTAARYAQPPVSQTKE